MSLLICNANVPIKKEKLRYALEWRIPCVTSDWLWECVKSGARMDYSQYYFTTIGKAAVSGSETPALRSRETEVLLPSALTLAGDGDEEGREVMARLEVALVFNDGLTDGIATGSIGSQTEDGREGSAARPSPRKPNTPQSSPDLPDLSDLTRRSKLHPPTPQSLSPNHATHPPPLLPHESNSSALTPPPATQSPTPPFCHEESLRLSIAELHAQKTSLAHAARNANPDGGRRILGRVDSSTSIRSGLFSRTNSIAEQKPVDELQSDHFALQPKSLSAMNAQSKQNLFSSQLVPSQSLGYDNIEGNHRYQRLRKLDGDSTGNGGWSGVKREEKVIGVVKDIGRRAQVAGRTRLGRKAGF